MHSIWILEAVYAVHWHQNVSFAPDDDWRQPKTATDAQMFNAAILDMLIKAGKYHPKLKVGPSRARISRRVTPFFSCTGGATLLVTPQFMASEWHG